VFILKTLQNLPEIFMGKMKCWLLKDAEEPSGSVEGAALVGEL
jgi:hypothetical protein